IAASRPMERCVHCRGRDCTDRSAYPVQTRSFSHGTEKMIRAPILFRVDAAPRLGWEHLSRCLTLAAAIQRRRRPAYFLSQLDPGSLALTIKRGGNDWLDADHPAGTPEDLEEVVQEVRRLRPAAVVVDAPD